MKHAQYQRETIIDVFELVAFFSQKQYYCYSIPVLIDDVSYSIRLFIILVVLWLVDAGAWRYTGARLTTLAAADLATSVWWSVVLLDVLPAVLWIAASSTARANGTHDYSEQDHCGTDWQDDRKDGVVVVVTRSGFSAWTFCSSM